MNPLGLARQVARVSMAGLAETARRLSLPLLLLEVVSPVAL
jgi:hypothetical protein